MTEQLDDKDYGFIQDIDYAVFLDSQKNSEGRPSKDYHCTISMPLPALSKSGRSRFDLPVGELSL